MTQNSMAVEIAVCTFRRPQIKDTLASLAAQQVPSGVQISILVIDNDETPSAGPLVDAFAEDSPVSVRYRHCPMGNISIARNGALDAAEARFLAFIDDDEIAAPTWIDGLVKTQRQTEADVVLGPVEAVYSDTAPAWMRRANPHSTAPVAVNGTIKTGYSCNVLIDLESSAVSGLRFDLALGRSGGEDTAYFTQAYRAGARFALAKDAIVREAVPEYRARLSWLTKRRFRSGQTHGRLLAEKRSRPGKLSALGLAALKVTYCLGCALVTLPNAARRNSAILRGALHIGTLSGLSGMRPITLYHSPASGGLK